MCFDRINMLRIYTDKTFLNNGYRKYVFPLLFDLCFLESGTMRTYYEVVDEEHIADIIIIPIDYGRFSKHEIALKGLLEKSKHFGKPLWLYTSGDFGFTVFIPNSFNFRLGGFHSKLDVNTFILPSFINDPYQTYLKTVFSPLDKQEKPSIGFVGHANKSLLKWVKDYINHKKRQVSGLFKHTYSDKEPFYPSTIKRALYLGKLKNDPRVTTDFILRNKYRAGSETSQSSNLSSIQFYENIQNNLYTFCMRGVGNFSVRFYETLAVGRIPILLDTDCRLPLHKEIDWSEHCVIVKESNARNILEEVLHFHDSKSNEDIKKVQEKNRLLWENYLSREAYFIKVQDIFSKNYER